MTTKSDYLLRLKIISLGNVNVGKSCLIKRYCEKRFISKYMATIGIDYGVTRLRIRNYDIRMNIFDFSGHPLFYEVRNEFYRDVQGVLLVFDLTNRRSFETLDYWICEMKKELNLNQGNKSSISIFIIGNKNDLKRVVEENEAKLWANVRGYQYFETSGIQNLFLSFDLLHFSSSCNRCWCTRNVRSIIFCIN
jgi:DnaJ family protein C protein 27